MSASFTLTLDTTGPGGVALALDGGATFTTDVDVVLGVSTTDPDTTGYMMKVWGSGIDTSFDANIQATEGASAWINYDPTKVIRLTTGDGSKSVSVKVRDDVDNPSGTVTDTITLDATAPIITITAGPTPTKISKQTGKRTSTFDWSPGSDIQAYKVKVVPSTGSVHTAGTQIPTAGGSTNMSGGSVSSGGSVTSTIDGADLETAGVEGDNIVKIFGQDLAGNWSVNS